MSGLSIRNVKKSFGTVDIIHGVDVEIADGEFTILVGPSGCGKSTLLRMIAGLEDITAGQISIDGRVVNNLQPKDRDIAMVFQNYALYPQMTVSQNMGFALELAGAKRPEIDKKVGEAAAILGLQPLLDRKPAQLSGGQRQRVAMGRAIVRDPKVFLFDEPLSNLDAKLRVKMRAEIKALHQRLKTTIVYVTHDQIEAMTMADKIVVLHGGRVEQIGSPLELYDRPRNIFVAGFLGSPAMNFLEGTIEDAGNPVLSLPGGSRVPLSRAPVNSANRPMTLGIRPEDISFGGENGVDAVVKVVEPTGSETHVAVDLDGRELTWVVRERVELAPEQQVKLSFETSKVHFFDRQTQQRLNA
ncbi:MULTISPECIES: ABC transporter ATP-binding protein [Rhizobium]|jgi:multiple sugar transport system ATP-binding protein|uniref:sn-glycerol-3-phosphate ABC transporter ATP-binding protein UgpC n=1 Tax=Rhizobium anhuiense TaxID=1184720 RepID=A0A3S0QPG5_9HYPH|nr:MULTISPECIES: sn-glycerol-3-phosphate ABC transporter ATP-binding protein UgpC [Rhizobium]KZS54985.1 sugar ABC transporter ATP-binding protein [Rhizobium anhuiense bv. trifolii]MBB3301718.1 multiple sugar transport system ATP-binding protein [Rhizobium sp. BK112]MBB3370812.1 multiple sugar transport system ATP-binding protein [Rhizobium sp. BK077]MBB4181580.1 multiple sugar transport system ATP-binding protein [Rhizobium sp. BK109]MBB4217915.1 multiple sugar transport system ATP-binding pro